MNPILRFLASLRSLRNSGAIKTIDQAFDFAKREFGEIDDLFKRQIEQIFKGPVKKTPKPGEGGITSIKNAPKKETPVQEPGTIMDRIGAASNRIDEILKEREAMYKPKPETSPLMEKLEKGVESLKQMKQPGMDLATGLTRTAARKILDRAGIQVTDKVDPTEIFIKEFGADVLGNVQNVAEEMIELERMGKSVKSMDEILEQEGMFNLERGRTDMPRGYTDEEMEEIKKAIEQEDILLGFDPKDRKPNSQGGINRTSFALGGVKAIMAIINKIKKLDPMDAMKEVNEVVAKRGKYKDLSDAETQKIFDDTQDHIFEREYKPSEFEMNVDEAYGVTPDMKKELDTMKDLGATKTAERFELKQKYPGIDDRLLTQIIDDPDPQRKAEAIATIDQAFELMRQGKSPDEILDIMKQMTDRTKQAGGGLSYLMGM
jgi:hypothetical protein